MTAGKIILIGGGLAVALIVASHQKPKTNNEVAEKSAPPSTAMLADLVKEKGDAEAIAKLVIQRQFNSDLCPRVIFAILAGNEIRAECSNRESFLIMNPTPNSYLAVRCGGRDFSFC